MKSFTLIIITVFVIFAIFEVNSGDTSSSDDDDSLTCIKKWVHSDYKKWDEQLDSKAIVLRCGQEEILQFPSFRKEKYHTITKIAVYVSKDGCASVEMGTGGVGEKFAFLQLTGRAHGNSTVVVQIFGHM